MYKITSTIKDNGFLDISLIKSDDSCISDGYPEDFNINGSAIRLEEEKTLTLKNKDYFSTAYMGVLNKDFQIFIYAINNDREFELGACTIPTLRQVGDNYIDDVILSGVEEFNCMAMTGRKEGDCYCEVIGRINVKQDENYNWIEPTKLIINRPIYETDWLDYEERLKGAGSLEVRKKVVKISKFKINGDMINIDTNITDIKTIGVAKNSFYLNVPLDPKNENVLVGRSRVVDSNKKEPNPNSQKSQTPGAGNKVLIETDDISSGKGISITANLYYNYT